MWNSGSNFKNVSRLDYMKEKDHAVQVQLPPDVLYCTPTDST